ncbi:MAG: hypothetical protein WCC90_10680 [Methylocella sp.]
MAAYIAAVYIAVACTAVAYTIAVAYTVAAAYTVAERYPLKPLAKPKAREVGDGRTPFGERRLGPALSNR